MQVNVGYSTGWLRGFVDGEGHVSVPQRYIGLANTEASAIADAVRHLNALGIAHRVHSFTRPPRKPILRIRVTRRADVARFIRLVGSGIPYKRQAMATILRYQRSHPPAQFDRWRPKPPRTTPVREYRKGPQPDPTEVERAYLDGNLTLDMLTAQFGYHDRASIRKFMKRHGIAFRSRSEGQRIRWSRFHKLQTDRDALD